MATLPYSRVVNVNLSRNDAFPSRRGFGTALILTSKEIPGTLDATLRTKLYASMDEVDSDFNSSDEAYQAALSAFSQNPRPITLKIGFVDVSTGFSSADMQDELDAIYNYDQDWYFITIEKSMRDESFLDGLVEWVQAKPKLALIDSNDVTTENAASTTNIAARNKGRFDRTGVFYHNVPDEYPAVAMAAYMSTRIFDDANSAYTAKFKRLVGISNINIDSSKLTAVTGFTPGLGQSLSAGHMANANINIGGRLFVVEGSTLTPNVFLDEIHATDWIIARTEEEALGILLNNARVPFTDAGLQTIASAPRTVMQVASRAGLVADDLNPTSGAYEAAVVVTVPSVFDVPESQRKARIAPAIQVRFRYAGAIHYVTINYQMTF